MTQKRKEAIEFFFLLRILKKKETVERSHFSEILSINDTDDQNFWNELLLSLCQETNNKDLNLKLTDEPILGINKTTLFEKGSEKENKVERKKDEIFRMIDDMIEESFSDNQINKSNCLIDDEDESNYDQLVEENPKLQENILNKSGNSDTLGDSTKYNSEKTKNKFPKNKKLKEKINTAHQINKNAIKIKVDLRPYVNLVEGERGNKIKAQNIQPIRIFGVNRMNLEN
jgi:hypothetical protein